MWLVRRNVAGLAVTLSWTYDRDEALQLAQGFAQRALESVQTLVPMARRYRIVHNHVTFGWYFVNQKGVRVEYLIEEATKED